jgi:hypothetical protein
MGALRIAGISASSDTGSTLRVGGLVASGAEATILPRLQVADLTVSGATVATLPKLHVDGLTADGTIPGGNPRLRVARIEASGTFSVSLNPIAPVTADYLDAVTVTATVASGTADTFVWRQISGPAVVMTGTGATRSLIAPAVFPPGGTVVLGVTAYSFGTPSTERTVSITVNPQEYWRRVDGEDWRPGWWMVPVEELGHEPVTETAGALPIGTASYTIPETNVMIISLTGNDSNSGSVLSPKRTLQGAQAAASAGWTVVARGGTYTGGLGVINKAITVQNYPGETVWFDGQTTVQHTMTIGSSVRFRGVGFKRYNVTNDAQFERGIVIPGTGSNTLFENCHFEDFGANIDIARNGNGAGPLRVFSCADVVIRRCTFKRSGVFHIYTNRTEGMIIENNLMDGSNMLGHPPQPLAAGVKHCRSVDAVFRHNICINNNGGQGFWLDVSCYRTVFHGNVVHGGYEAILVELSGTALVVGNYIRSGTVYGLRALCSSQVTIGWNEVVGGGPNPHIEIAVLQDERRNQGDEPYLAQGVTWLARNNKVIANRVGPTFAYGQIGVYDYTSAARGGPTQAAVDMIDMIAGNEYIARSDGRNESFQWSHTAGQTFAGRSLTQLIAAHPTKVKRENVVMPADVAALFGIPAGGLYVGPVKPAPVPVA